VEKQPEKVRVVLKEIIRLAEEQLQKMEQVD